MQEKTTKYHRAKRIASESYKEGDAFITKIYYDDKKNSVKERTKVIGAHKEVNHFTSNGVFAKSENFLNDKRHGIETKYAISKANASVKSTKCYEEGKLHGESITYDLNDRIIKHEVFALGKLVLKYLRKEGDANEITGVEIVDMDNLDKLPTAELEKLQTHRQENPEWFKA
jgi:antitoxin component YwqK of YwqJK toxin-antitoxin module